MGRGKSVVLRLGLGTLIVMPLIAILIDRYSDDVNLALAIVGKVNPGYQLLIGIPVGLAIAFVAQWISERSWMEKSSKDFSALFSALNLNLSDKIFISFCAGVGEEILFRGAVQPIFGIIITSVLFVAIHGYLNPKDWRISIYGLFMTIAMCGVGWMSIEVGLISAIIAHTIIDIYLLVKMKQEVAIRNEDGPSID